MLKKTRAKTVDSDNTASDTPLSDTPLSDAQLHIDLALCESFIEARKADSHVYERYVRLKLELACRELKAA